MGWLFTIVNAADWVPKVPLSIQTVQDFNALNPLANAKDKIKNLPFPQDRLLLFMHRRLIKHDRKAMKKHQLYLEKMASKMVEKNVPRYKSPASFYDSNNYMRCGSMIVLDPDD